MYEKLLLKLMHEQINFSDFLKIIDIEFIIFI